MNSQPVWDFVRHVRVLTELQAALGEGPLIASHAAYARRTAPWRPAASPSP